MTRERGEGGMTFDNAKPLLPRLVLLLAYNLTVQIQPNTLYIQITSCTVYVCVYVCVCVCMCVCVCVCVCVCCVYTDFDSDCYTSHNKMTATFTPIAHHLGT